MPAAQRAIQRLGLGVVALLLTSTVGAAPVAATPGDQTPAPSALETVAKKREDRDAKKREKTKQAGFASSSKTAAGDGKKRKKKPRPTRMQKTQAEYAAGAYAPTNRVIFNDPLGNDAAKWRVNDEIFSAIAHAKKGSTIRIITFNIASRKATDLLIAAHRRGVRVGVIAAQNIPADGSISRLRSAFKGSDRSYMKTCQRSCRGRVGVMHSKIYTFSHTGQARNVTMYGTGNVTRIGAVNQWTSLRVWPNNESIYRWNQNLINEMPADVARANAFRARDFGKVRQIWQPNYGKGAPNDPVLALLSQVKCKGATTGYRGRTVLQIGIGAWQYDRGIRVANRVRQLWNNGCEVRVMYTQMGGRIHSILSDPSGRGGIPMREVVVQNGTAYPTYLHLKTFLVNGNYGTNRGARIVWDGSPNIADGALRADEQIYRDTTRPVFDAYAQRLNSIWSSNAFPRMARTIGQARAATPVFARSNGAVVNPYDNIQVN